MTSFVYHALVVGAKSIMRWVEGHDYTNVRELRTEFDRIRTPRASRRGCCGGWLLIAQLLSVAGCCICDYRLTGACDYSCCACVVVIGL